MMTESGAQLLARLEARHCLKDIEARLFPGDGRPEHGEVVELHGAEGTGKTELLYHLLCRCVLPVACGGLEVEVVFVDTDYSLDMLRLVSVLDSRLSSGPSKEAAFEGRTHIRPPSNQLDGLAVFPARSSSSSPPADSDEAMLRSCLSRLLVVHCSSSSQLLLTLHFLETSLVSRPKLALLLIDSISAFYWQDRYEGGASITKQEERLSSCTALLARLLRDYRITIFATCHNIRRSHTGPTSSASSSSCASSSDSDRPYLCRSWQRLVSHRLLCCRESEGKNKVPSAGGNKEQRNRHVFTVHCTSSRTKTDKSSSFYVTDEGVQFI